MSLFNQIEKPQIPRRQKGVALITAMLVLALAALLAVELSDSQFLAIRRTSNVVVGDTAWEYCVGMEAWAQQILRRDAKQGQIDHLGEVWATQAPPLPVQGGMLQGRLVDQQGLFNLNNLVVGGQAQIKQLAYFKRLLAQVQVAPELADAVVDWLDADDNPLNAGAEDGMYLRMTPPYRAANRPMVDVSELRLVAGWDEGNYRKILPYITALPQQTSINANTAPSPVLMAIGENPSTNSARIQETQQQGGFKTIGEVIELLGLPKAADSSMLSLSSQYFMVETQASIGGYRVGHRAILRRVVDKVIVIWRVRGNSDGSTIFTAPTGS